MNITLKPFQGIQAPEKSVLLKIIDLIYKPKHILWVFNRTVLSTQMNVLTDG